MHPRFTDCLLWLKSGSFPVKIFLAILFLCSCAHPAIADGGTNVQVPESQPFRIGVLAKRGEVICRENWQPTVDYLNNQVVGITFELVPLPFEKVYEEAERDGIDFYIVNPMLYIGLSYEFGVRCLGTLLNRDADEQGMSEFGSVVFFRRENNPSPEWRDLKGLTVGAVNSNSFGGWMVAQYEAAEIEGLDLFRDVRFLGSHDAVVRAVEAGQIDAGIVRTDSLERMAEEGKISLDSFSVIEHCLKSDPEHAHFIFLHSTALYPEWPISAAAHIPDDVAKTVAVALLEMPPDSEAARRAGSRGWTVAADYSPVQEVMVALCVAPFDQAGRVTYLEAARQHWKPFLAFVLLFIAVAIMAFHLAIKVRDLRRTRSMLQEALQEQTRLKTAAEASSRAKSEFLSVMSHELRTPLNPILSLSGLLMEMFEKPESIDPDEAREFFGMIEQGGAHLKSHLTDILDFVQIGSDEHSVVMETVNLSELVAECVNEIQSEAEKKGLRLVYEAEEKSSAFVQSNRLLLLSLVRKLLKNAVDYSEHGEIRVFCNREKDWDYIRVEDDGIGMTGKEIKKIFEPFYKVDSSNMRTVGGIGLGLSLVHKIVDTLGGRIEVTSKPRVGSNFTVWLPR